MIMDRRVPKWLHIFRRVSIAAVFFPIGWFVATHDLTPEQEPGGFGEGYDNLLAIILLAPVVILGLFGWGISSLLIWNRRSSGNDFD
jgi:hypothetical protein